MPKPREKSGENSGELRTPRHGGGKIRAGSKPGNKPGTGRPPNEFKKLCQQLATRKSTIAAVSKILKDDKHPAYLGALKWASEHGYGRPTQPVEHSGSVTVEHLLLARAQRIRGDGG